ncbi:MAG: hypothetical protein Q4G33_15400 [bacterium]|nr:hypothetical protein [bacterium]
MEKMISTSIRLSNEQNEIVTQLSKSLHISKSDAIRQFIDKDKIIIVEGFDELLPMLAAITRGVQSGDIPHKENVILREAVNKLW